jgi:hypothetical protein
LTWPALAPSPPVGPPSSPRWREDPIGEGRLPSDCQGRGMELLLPVDRGWPAPVSWTTKEHGRWPQVRPWEGGGEEAEIPQPTSTGWLGGSSRNPPPPPPAPASSRSSTSSRAGELEKLHLHPRRRAREARPDRRMLSSAAMLEKLAPAVACSRSSPRQPSTNEVGMDTVGRR